jgi:hypothetical protein
MFRRIVALSMMATSLLLVGCVSTKNVKADVEMLRADQPATVTVSARKKPDFTAMTAGKAAIGGLIGAIAMIKAGNDIVEENDVQDPASYIGAELAKSLTESLGVQLVDNGGKLAASGKPGDLAKVYDNAHLLLDVQTVNWSFTYFPTDWNNYRVVYSAKLRLVDTRTGKLRAEGFCARVPEKSDGAPSRDQLLADNAALLKNELKVAADYCIGQFKTNVLGV